MEINFRHGDALDLADQILVFKRTMREAALKHNVAATFMAKPMTGEPGSAMHLHQSVVDIATGKNIFSNEDGSMSELFLHHIGGLQKFIPEALPLFAPNVNSFRRFLPDTSAPVNVEWGEENRTVGLRVPDAGPQNRRVENRLPGADANPYLAIAASLLCGYIGMVEGIEPSAPVQGRGYERRNLRLPLTIEDALERMENSRPWRSTWARNSLPATSRSSAPSMKTSSASSVPGSVSSCCLLSDQPWAARARPPDLGEA
jgi:glutamine synthetase